MHMRALHRLGWASWQLVRYVVQDKVQQRTRFSTMKVRKPSYDGCDSDYSSEAKILREWSRLTPPVDRHLSSLPIGRFFLFFLFDTHAILTCFQNQSAEISCGHEERIQPICTPGNLEWKRRHSCDQSSLLCKISVNNSFYCRLVSISAGVPGSGWSP